jgi:Rrf2 family protein
MRISSKGRYGLATMIFMAEQHNSGEYITIISISESLEISKIYLEQIFAQLKKANIIISVKGPQGGYRLAKSPEAITAFDVLSAIEDSVFEKAETSVLKSAEPIEMAMQKAVFDLIDSSVAQTLKNISLDDLVHIVEKNKHSNDFMFYI